jgi:hypothetical protein
VFAPVEVEEICKKEIVVRLLREVPFGETKVVFSLYKPMGFPFSDMAVRLFLIANSILRILLVAISMRWPKLLPAPPIREIHFGVGQFQHDAMRKLN